MEVPKGLSYWKTEVIVDKHGKTHQLPIGRTLDLLQHFSPGRPWHEMKLRDIPSNSIGACRVCQGTRYVYVRLSNGTTVITRCKSCNCSGEVDYRKIAN